MSVVVFVNENCWKPAGKNACIVTLSGLAFAEIDYDGFCRKLINLKEKFFKRQDIGGYPLRGRLLLNRRSLDSYRKREFVQELFSLGRLQKGVVFSFTKSYQQSPHDKIEKPDIDLSAGQERSNEMFPFLLERVNAFTLERHPGRMANLIFKLEDRTQSKSISEEIMQLVYKSPYAQGFQGISGAPMFMPSSHSPGLQAADVFAYIINQHQGGRYEMKDFYSEVESLQYVSSYEVDDYQLRGINVIS